MRPDDENGIFAAREGLVYLFTEIVACANGFAVRGTKYLHLPGELFFQRLPDDGGDT